MKLMFTLLFLFIYNWYMLHFKGMCGMILYVLSTWITRVKWSSEFCERVEYRNHTTIFNIPSKLNITNYRARTNAKKRASLVRYRYEIYERANRDVFINSFDYHLKEGVRYNVCVSCTGKTQVFCL